MRAWMYSDGEDNDAIVQHMLPLPLLALYLHPALASDVMPSRAWLLTYMITGAT